MKNDNSDPDAPLNGSSPDAELLQQFVNGDQGAFGKIVSRYADMVFRVNYRMLRHHHDAEDAFQATFLVLATKAKGLAISELLGPWLYGVAYRISRRAAQKRSRRKETSISEDIMSKHNTFQAVAERNEQRLLDDEINKLPEKLRTPLVLHSLMGKTYGEIADELHISRWAVEGRIKRAKGTLRSRLILRGVQLSVVVHAIHQSGSAVQAAPRLVEKAVDIATHTAGGESGAVNEQAQRLAAEEFSSGMSSISSLVAATALAIVVLFGFWFHKTTQVAAAEASSMEVITIEPSFDASTNHGLYSTTTRFVAFPARPQDGNARTDTAAGGSPLVFPKDKSLGMLFVRDYSPLSSENWMDGWNQLSEARGAIVAPSGKQTKLEVNARTAEDLALLEQLPRDSIDALSLHGINVDRASLSRLQHFTSLQSLVLGGTKLTDDDMKLLQLLPNLKVLDISNTKVGDTGVEHLVGLRHLEHIGLGRTAVTDSVGKHIEKMTRLRSIKLELTDTGDRLLKHLASLPNLRSLHFYANTITDEGLATLTRSRQLEALGLGKTLITNSGMTSIRRLKSLKFLDMTETAVDESGLAQLTDLRRLESLSIDNLGDEGMAHVRQIESLRRIGALGDVTDKGLAMLAGHPNVSELNLGSKVTDEGLLHLARMSGITSLIIQHAERVTDNGLRSISQLPRLGTLTVGGTGVTFDGFSCFTNTSSLRKLHFISKSAKPNLESISKLGQLSHLALSCESLRADDLKPLRELTNLQHLTLSGFPVDDRAAKHVSQITSLKSELSLRDGELTDLGLRYLSKLGRLERLEVAGRFTDIGLSQLVDARSLVDLEIQSPNVTEEGMHRLRTNHPNLQRLRSHRVRAEPRFLQVGAVAPEFRVKTMDGKNFQLSEHRGKAVVIYFWATWCSPCVASTPDIKKFYETYRKKYGERLEMISLSLDDLEHLPRRFAERNELTWHQACIGDSQLREQYGIPGVPSYFVVSPDGRIVCNSGKTVETSIDMVFAE